MECAVTAGVVVGEKYNIIYSVTKGNVIYNTIYVTIALTYVVVFVLWQHQRICAMQDVINQVPAPSFINQNTFTFIFFLIIK